MASIKDFKDLRVWQLGMEIVSTIYSVTRYFPREEIWGLTNQMRRASVSIPANISEGHIKGQTKKFARFLNIALGSCAELETLVLIAENQSYIDGEQSKQLIELILSESKQISSLRKRLKTFD